MAGDSVRQRQFLAGARLLKRLLCLCGPFQADLAVSVCSASAHSSTIPSFSCGPSLYLNALFFGNFSDAGGSNAAQLGGVWPCVFAV